MIVKLGGFLINKNDLFPYNHKYLIEGYSYSKNFNGDKVYLGMDKCFASLMKYVPIEVFYMKRNNNNLDIVKRASHLFCILDLAEVTQRYSALVSGL